MFGELDESQRLEGGVAGMTNVFTGRPGHRLLLAPAGQGQSCKRDFVSTFPQMTFPTHTI